MRILVLALVLAAGCTAAVASRSEALDQDADMAAPDLAPPAGACGNGNTVCAPDQLCYHGDCITLCGSPSCWMQMQAAWGMCGGS